LNGKLYVGPWVKLSELLGFGHSHAGHLRQLVPWDSVLETPGFVGVTADGLAQACATSGHARQLLCIAHDCGEYACLHCAFIRLCQQPVSTFKSTLPLPLQTVQIVTAGGVPWFVEQSILQLFDAEHVSHPERLVQSMITTFQQHQRAMQQQQQQQQTLTSAGVTFVPADGAAGACSAHTSPSTAPQVPHSSHALVSFCVDACDGWLAGVFVV
jgi:hypothetical protein